MVRVFFCNLIQEVLDLKAAHLKSTLQESPFFCNRDLVRILKISFKVPDWNVKEVVSGTLCLSEER